jgi:hypothetical protein
LHTAKCNMTSDFFLNRRTNVSGSEFPTRWHNLLADYARAKVVQGHTAIQLLEHAVLPIGAGLREVRLLDPARGLDRRVRPSKCPAYPHAVPLQRGFERLQRPDDTCHTCKSPTILPVYYLWSNVNWSLFGCLGNLFTPSPPEIWAFENKKREDEAKKRIQFLD